MPRQKAERRLDSGSSSPSPRPQTHRKRSTAAQSPIVKSNRPWLRSPHYWGLGGIIAICLIAAGISAYEFSPSTVARRHLDQGRTYERAGQTDLAEHEFNAAIDADGKNPNAWWALAEHDYNAGQYEEAHDAYAEVQKLRPNTPHLDSRMAVCAMKTNDAVTAYDLAKKALKIDPNDADALSIQVQMAVSNGAALQDLDNIRRLAKLKPDDTQVLELSGNTLISQGLYDEAKPIVDHLLAINPSDSFGRFEQDVITVETSSTPAQLTSTVDDLQHAIVAHPKYYLAYRYLGKAYARQSRWKEAADELEKAAELRPNRKEIQFELMDVYRHTGDTKKLAAAQARFNELTAESNEAFRLEKQLDVDPNNFEENLKLGQIRIQEGEYRVAHRYIARAAQINPNDPRVIAAVNTLVNASGKSPTEEN